MKQKLTVFLLMIYCCLLFSGIHSVSAATSGTCGTNLTWTLDDAGTLTISGTGDMSSWTSYSSVPWYSNRSEVKKVVIGNSVTSIGNRAFNSCPSLTSITIGDSVTTIGNDAFIHCVSLTSVTIGTGVTSIGEWAFYDCTSLTNITIPDRVTSIGYRAFYACTSLTSVTIGTGVTSIGDYAFSWCESLTSIAIGDSVTTIGDRAFYYCESLTDVYYHGTAEEWNAISIGSGNTPLQSAMRHYVVSVTLLNPDGTEYAKWMQLPGTALDMDKIPATDGSSISVYKDSDMTQEYDLDTIINEDTVLYVKVIVASGTCGDNLTWTLNDAGTLTISGTGDMYSWDYDSSAPWYSHRSKVKKVVIENGVTTIGDCAFYYCYSLTSITIPDSVTSIGEYAFYRCTRLTSVTIGNGVTSIGWWAFYRCNSLTSVTIGDSVTSIGYSAFEDCASLTSITIPDSVSTISDRAFDSCTSLTSVTIPDSVTTIGDYVFYDCLSLTNIIVDENNANFSSIDGNLFDKNHTTLIQYATGKTETAYVIPDSVTGIVYDAFRNCTSLTSVTIPDSVTTIGECAFHNCTSLTDVYYHGTAEEWNAISIGYGNTPLQSATRHYVVSVTLLNPDGTEYAKWTQLPGTALDVDKIPAIDGSSISVYKDSAMTQEYDLDTIINEDTVLYVKVIGGIKAKLSDDKKQLEVQPLGISEGSKILVAFYQDGKFQQVQPETYKGEALFFPVNQAYTDIKIMAWQNFDTLKSLCVPEEIPIQ